MKNILSGFRSLVASPHIRAGLGLLLSGITLYLAIRNVDYSKVWSTLLRANLLFVGLALVSVAINTVGKAVRWKILMGTSGQPVPFSMFLSVLLIGQMLNNLFPARLGDVSRAYIIGSKGPGRVFTLGTVVLEKFLDMLSYVLLFFLLLVLFPLPVWISDSALVFSLVTLVFLVAVVVLLRQRDWVIQVLDRMIAWFPGRIQEKTRQRLQSGMASLEILQSRADRLWLVGWSALIWGTAILNNYLVLFALQIHTDLSLPFIAAMVILVVLQLGISLPSAPATIGVFQYGCVIALAVFGINQSVAFSYGVLLHAIVMVPTTLIGMILFWKMGISRKQLED